MPNLEQCLTQLMLQEGNRRKSFPFLYICPPEVYPKAVSWDKSALRRPILREIPLYKLLFYPKLEAPFLSKLIQLIVKLYKIRSKYQ